TVVGIGGVGSAAIRVATAASALRDRVPPVRGQDNAGIAPIAARTATAAGDATAAAASAAGKRHEVPIGLDVAGRATASPGSGCRTAPVAAAPRAAVEVVVAGVPVTVPAPGLAGPAGPDRDDLTGRDRHRAGHLGARAAAPPATEGPLAVGARAANHIEAKARDAAWDCEVLVVGRVAKRGACRQRRGG